MAETVTIDRRFRGPPQSGNGGYTCGIVARAIGSQPAEVTLRQPPPLERQMVLERNGDGIELRDGESLVAEGRPVDALDLEVPEPVTLAEARAAREASALHDHHAWPMCFVCGPDRPAGDGLRVICGAVEGREIVAAPWEVDASLPLDGSAVAPEMVWAALDCPGGLAVLLKPDQPVAALGRLSASIEADVRPGETYVAMGWLIGREGRKLHTGSAIFSRDGELVGRAKGVWVELTGDRLGAKA